MTYMNMNHELKSLILSYFGNALEPIITDSILNDLKNLVTSPKICTACSAELFWDSRASAYTDDDGRTTTMGISSSCHHHIVPNVQYKFERG